MIGAHILYSDRLVEITEAGIRFNDYYFPAGSKTVLFSSIEAVTMERPDWRNGKWRLHGSGDLRTWFPRDWHRPSRPVIFFARLRRERRRGPRRIGFTVEDSDTVERILSERGLLDRGAF